MVELTPQQMQVLERLFASGFRPIAIPSYESALCLRRGECAVMLVPEENGVLRVLAPASILVDGHFGVRLKRKFGDVFVWKQTNLPVTAERLANLEAFRKDLTEILSSPETI